MAHTHKPNILIFFPYFLFLKAQQFDFFLSQLDSVKNQWNMIDFNWKKIKNLLKKILFPLKIMLDAWNLVRACNFISKIRIRQQKFYELNFLPINRPRISRHFFHFQAIYLRKIHGSAPLSFLLSLPRPTKCAIPWMLIFIFFFWSCDVSQKDGAQIKISN